MGSPEKQEVTLCGDCPARGFCVGPTEADVPVTQSRPFKTGFTIRFTDKYGVSATYGREVGDCYPETNHTKIIAKKITTDQSEFLRNVAMRAQDCEAPLRKPSGETACRALATPALAAMIEAGDKNR